MLLSVNNGRRNTYFSLQYQYWLCTVMAVFKNIYLIKPIHWDIWTYRLFNFLTINLSEFLIDETLGKCYSHLVAWLKIWIHALTIRTPRNKKHLHPINSKPTFLHALNINSQKILFFSRIVSVLLTQLVYTCWYK